MKLPKKRLLSLALIWTLIFNPLMVRAEVQRGRVAAEDMAFMIHVVDLDNGEVILRRFFY